MRIEHESGRPAPRALGMAPDDPVTTRTRLVLLGTAGGPAHLGGGRFGISTALVYGDDVYVVDLGLGALQRLTHSGLGPAGGLGDPLSTVRGIFFTHLHSDHSADWPAVYATGTANVGTGRLGPPIQVFGPGPRPAPIDALGVSGASGVSGAASPSSYAAGTPRPGRGIAGMTDALRSAFAADLTDRVRSSGTIDPDALFDIREIDLTRIWPATADGVPPRLDEPIPVWRDGDVAVTATLVDHRPMAPAFAYRFDTPDGSVVISGDTCVSQNLVDLARDCDYLVHEVIDPDFIARVAQALPAGQGEAMRHHLAVSHTTIEQVGRDVAEPANVTTLVLSHLVPATAPVTTWSRARRGFRGRLIVGEDLLSLPVPGPLTPADAR